MTPLISPIPLRGMESISMTAKPGPALEFDPTNASSWLEGEHEIRRIDLGKSIRNIKLHSTVWVILEEICRQESLSLDEMFAALADRCRSTRAKALGRAAEVFIVSYNRLAVAPSERVENIQDEAKAEPTSITAAPPNMN